MTAIQRFCCVFLVAILSIASAPAWAEDTYGNADDPLVAEALGTEIHSRDPEEVRFVILSKLMDRYAAAQRIDVKRGEIESYLAGLRRIAEDHRKHNEMRRKELIHQLEAQALTGAQKESLASQLASLNELMATLAEGASAPKEASVEEKRYQEEVAVAFIRQWKINRSLYGQYRGRVIFQQGGPEPLDAYRRFLEEQKEFGAFTILDKALEAKFWDYYRNDDIHSFYPAGSDEEARAFDTPWWLQAPRDDM